MRKRFSAGFSGAAETAVKRRGRVVTGAAETAVKRCGRVVTGAAETAVKRRGAEPVWPARERCDSDALHLKG